MVFSLPDKGEGANDVQSILFQEYLDVVVAAILRVDYVLSGCAITAQGTPDMTVAVAKGAVLSNGALFPVTAGNATITTADATNPRLDLVVVTSAGAKAVRAGTPGANPKPPVRTANDVVLAVVYVPAADTTIGANQITDLRMLMTGGTNLLKKVTTAVSFANSAAANVFFSIVLPSGLFLTGKILRVRMGGTFLINSGTPTITLRIRYGATTMFQDVSIAGAVDADRGAWRLDYDLVAQANNDQALNGFLTFSPVIAQRVAATNGIGEMLLNATAANNPHQTPLNGAAAIDSDAADITHDVAWTMSVANAANDIVMEYATAELI